MGKRSDAKRNEWDEKLRRLEMEWSHFHSYCSSRRITQTGQIQRIFNPLGGEIWVVIHPPTLDEIEAAIRHFFERRLRKSPGKLKKLDAAIEKFMTHLRDPIIVPARRLNPLVKMLDPCDEPIRAAVYASTSKIDEGIRNAFIEFVDPIFEALGIPEGERYKSEREEYAADWRTGEIRWARRYRKSLKEGMVVTEPILSKGNKPHDPDNWQRDFTRAVKALKADGDKISRWNISVKLNCSEKWVTEMCKRCFRLSFKEAVAVAEAEK